MNRVNRGISGNQISEFLVIVCIIGAVYAGFHYYFVDYQHSAAYALGAFINAVKTGDAEKQYELLDDADKKYDYPKLGDYSQTSLAKGYVDRISGYNLSREKPDEKKPNIVKINVSVSILKLNQEIYQASADSYNDVYTLRKDGEGNWKIWLGRSELNMLNAKALLDHR